jgi:hypothetical protein
VIQDKNSILLQGTRTGIEPKIDIFSGTKTGPESIFIGSGITLDFLVFILLSINTFLFLKGRFPEIGKPRKSQLSIN